MNVCELNIDQTVVIGDKHYRQGQKGYAIAIDASDSENDAKVTLRMPDGKLCTLSERDISPLPPPAPRPLSSLTDEECAELYLLAFPRDKPHPVKVVRNSTTVDITGYDFMLSIYKDGDMCVTANLTGEGETFAALAVVRYLDSLGIALG